MRNQGLLDEPVETLFTAGIIPAVRWLIESDRNDDRFWHWCDVCDGLGYQEEK